MRGGLYIVLAHEGVSERRDTWALGPISTHRQVPDVRAGGRMSGGSRRAGCPGLGRMFGMEWPILLLSGWRAPDFRAGSGCLGVGRIFGRCRVAWLLSLSGILLVGGTGCPGSCRMFGRYSCWHFFLLLPWLPRTLVLGPWVLHGLLGCTVVCTRSALEVATKSHANAKEKHLGMGSPCVQWRIVELSSYVSLGLGE